ncbi:MAG: energy transducer TonB [Proteobacteria bacterium]|nr:energy transducer TonB [Pseudomonadota bacterium]
MEFALKRPEPGKWTAAVFSLLMHGILLLALFYGMQWQHHPAEAVSVELVRSLPPMAVPEPEPPQETPKAEPLPPPPKPVEVKPVEVKQAEVPKPVVKPDIALKEPEKKKVEKKKEEPKPEPPQPEKKPEKKEVPAPVQSRPLPKPVEKKPDVPPKMSDMDKLLARESDKVAAATNEANMRAKLDAAAGAASKAASAASLGRATGDWIGQIAQKVKSNLMRPQGVTGNPLVEFEIQLLPSGEILGDPKLTKSSGNSNLDEAARRAILKSSPLPKPSKAEVFQREITLKFHPMADGE